MKKLLLAFLCCIALTFNALGQETDTVVNVNLSKQMLFSNTQMWGIKTKPYIEKDIVLSDSELGKTIIKTNIKVNKDDIVKMSYIGYSLEFNTVIDVKDNAYRISLESPSVLIDINPSLSLNRMNTKQLLKYKDELELIESIVLDDRLLNDIIHWSIDDVYAKYSSFSSELDTLKKENRPSKRKIEKIEKKLSVICEIIDIWNNYSEDIKSSIVESMDKDNSF